LPTAENPVLQLIPFEVGQVLVLNGKRIEVLGASQTFRERVPRCTCTSRNQARVGRGCSELGSGLVGQLSTRSHSDHLCHRPIAHPKFTRRGDSLCHLRGGISRFLRSGAMAWRLQLADCLPPHLEFLRSHRP